MCVTGDKTFDTILVIGLTVAATVVAGPQAGMATYAMIGAASGAAMAGAQGRDPLTGALIGAVTGGVTGGAAPPGVDQVGSQAAQQAAQVAAQQAAADTITGQLGAALTQAAGASTFTSIAAQQVGQVALGTAAVGAFGLMMPGAPSLSGYTPAAQVTQAQQFNSQQIATTGSGGRQASASLAQAISRSKKRKLSQADVSDLSIDTSSFASTGLQFA
jgi:hypothetical protein